MDELAKDTLIYCLEEVIKEVRDTINLYIQNKLDDVNVITLKTGSVIFWMGACINKLDENNIKFEIEDYSIVRAVKASANSLKHNKKIVKVVKPVIISSPICGACFSGSSLPISRFHRHIEGYVIWETMPQDAVHKKEDINAFNENLATHDFLKSLDLIQNIIIKYLNKLN